MRLSIFHLLREACRTKQDLLATTCFVSVLLLLSGIVLTFFGLFLAVLGVPSTFLDNWLLRLITFCFYGSFAIAGVCCFFLFMVRLPLVAFNRRQQIKRISSLDWHLRKPKDILDVSKFEHLLIIGITLWSFQDMNGLELFQGHFGHREWSVHVFFMDDISTLRNIQTFSPGTEFAWPSPVITEYCAGVVVRSLYGQDALKWMKQA